MKTQAVALTCLTPVFMMLLGGREARGVLILESGGRVVAEAEHFSSRTDHPVHRWLNVPGESTASNFANARGGQYLQVLPDINGFRGNITVPPFVDYRARISTPGTYQLYVRWDGSDPDADSFYAQVLELSDGPGGSIADWYRYTAESALHIDRDFGTNPWHGVAGFERTDPFGGAVPATWEIAAAGDYTLRFIMREDGVALDTFVFQLSSQPAPTGFGPPESQIVPEPSTGLLGATGIGGLILYNWRRRGRARSRVLGFPGSRTA